MYKQIFNGIKKIIPKISETELYDKLDEFRQPHLWEKIGNDPTHCKNWKLKIKVK